MWEKRNRFKYFNEFIIINSKGLAIMRTLFTTLILIFLIVNVSAIEVSEYEGVIPTNPDGTQNFNVELLQKYATLENKISNLASKQDMETQTAFIYNNLNTRFSNKTDLLILCFVFIQLFQLGLGYSIFLYLKSQRRI